VINGSKGDDNLDGSNQKKETNVTVAKKLGKKNECHHGQQIGRFLAINTTCHAMPFASHTTMLKNVTTYKLKGDEHH
jgi:hypothetical protein